MLSVADWLGVNSARATLRPDDSRNFAPLPWLGLVASLVSTFTSQLYGRASGSVLVEDDDRARQQVEA